MRLFFALWPPAGLALQLHDWGKELSVEAGGRVIRAQSIHLTLAFLGELSTERCAEAITAARAIEAESFNLVLDQPGYFRHNRIAWTGPSTMPAALRALAESLGQALRQAHLPLERRAFVPHVTLMRDAREPRSWPALPALQWPVEAFVLVQSVRDDQGARYVVLERFALQTPAPRAA